ncbi:MAG: glycosyltransferase family 4 protein [Desulfosoma sp.]|uniref:glycosyltransferase family 4 protein n=1 Tax=Desulfosoma sp. TaxID=2603217 RepID=UPI0040492E59
MRIAFYGPNKPLGHSNPSGDQTIARGLVQALEGAGHACREMSRFRARWFWREKGGWHRAVQGVVEAFRRSMAWRPHLWLSYHSYYKAPDVIGPWLSRLLRIPYVLVQPMYGTKYRRHAATRLGFYLNRWALQCAHLAVTNNRNDLEALERVVPLNRLAYVAPGIFPEMFERREAARRVVRAHYGFTAHHAVLLTVARFRPGVKRKSLHFLFHALAGMREDPLPWRLVVVGDGPLEAEIHETAARHLGRRVVFAGRVARRDLYAYYSAGDLFVFPGIRESLGMVYLEAQACGLPVVALREGGVGQVVCDGLTGILICHRDAQAYTEAVRNLLQNEPQRLAFGRKAVRYVHRHHNLHRQVRYLVGLLESLVEHAA